MTPRPKLIALAGALLMGGLPACAAQAPEPAAGRAAGPGGDAKTLARELRRTLRDYIEEASEEYEGRYPVQEPDSEETWMLRFIGPAEAPPRRIDPDTYALRGRFRKEAGPKASPVEVLVDFTFEWHQDEWAVIDERLVSAGAKVFPAETEGSPKEASGARAGDRTGDPEEGSD